MMPTSEFMSIQVLPTHVTTTRALLLALVGACAMPTVDLPADRAVSGKADGELAAGQPAATSSFTEMCRGSVALLLDGEQSPLSEGDEQWFFPDSSGSWRWLCRELEEGSGCGHAATVVHAQRRGIHMSWTCYDGMPAFLGEAVPTATPTVSGETPEGALDESSDRCNDSAIRVMSSTGYMEVLRGDTVSFEPEAGSPTRIEWLCDGVEQEAFCRTEEEVTHVDVAFAEGVVRWTCY